MGKKRPDKQPNNRGRSMPFLVRYDHESCCVFVDLPHPLMLRSDDVFQHVKRIHDSYHFYTFESQRGDLMAAYFQFKQDFFSLSSAPQTLVADTRWLSLETGIPALTTVDIWWVATTSFFLMLEDSEEEDGEPT